MRQTLQLSVAKLWKPDLPADRLAAEITRFADTGLHQPRISPKHAAMPENTARTRERGGQWRKGYCPNPGGRPKAALDVQALARQYTEQAVRTLVEALRDPRHKVAAATALLDRGWGKPTDTVHSQHDVNMLHLIGPRRSVLTWCRNWA